MNELSKELCELCGIEPKIKAEYHKIDIPTDFISNRTNAAIFTKEVEVYPGFEQPENFVKLLELLHKSQLTITYMTFDYKQHYTQEFLSHFIECLRTYGDKLVCENIKQVIKNTEWGY